MNLQNDGLREHKRSPDAIKNIAVWVNPQHDVLHCSVVNERALRVDEEDVRNPDLLHQPGVESAAQVVSRGKSQTLVFPVVPQV